MCVVSTPNCQVAEERTERGRSERKMEKYYNFFPLSLLAVEAVGLTPGSLLRLLCRWIVENGESGSHLQQGTRQRIEDLARWVDGSTRKGIGQAFYVICRVLFV